MSRTCLGADEERNMDAKMLSSLLKAVRDGQTSPDEAASLLARLPYQDLGYAAVDHHRHLRNGFPEVVFGQGKTPEQIVGILRELLAHDSDILVTRIDRDKAHAVRRDLPQLEWDETSRTLTLRKSPWKNLGRGPVCVVCAGTSDLPVAAEAKITASMMGNAVDLIVDVGVAGIHRLLDRLDILERATVIVVVAGMEGALPSVVGGLVSRPIVAVPTSIGYGAALGGMTTLLAMLNSCVAGVTVVNIDNGFGAGYAAALINRRQHPLAVLENQGESDSE